MAMTSLVLQGLSSSHLCCQNNLKRAKKCVFIGGFSVRRAKTMMHVVGHNQMDLGDDVSHVFLPSGYFHLLFLVYNLVSSRLLHY
jgi:hypothetical protein